MFEEYKNEMCMRSRILSDDVQSIVSCYQRKERALHFLKDLLYLLQNDEFLALDPSLLEKIYHISTLLSFRFSDTMEVRELRRFLFAELFHYKRKLKKDGDAILENLLQREYQVRRIPESYPLDADTLLEIYRLDFENYTAIHVWYPEKIKDIFCYLTTVNKIYTDYPDYIYNKKAAIHSMLMQLYHSYQHDKNLKEYVSMTEDRITRTEDPSKKLALFPLCGK